MLWTAKLTCSYWKHLHGRLSWGCISAPAGLYGPTKRRGCVFTSCYTARLQHIHIKAITNAVILFLLFVFSFLALNSHGNPSILFHGMSGHLWTVFMEYFEAGQFQDTLHSSCSSNSLEVNQESLYWWFFRTFWTWACMNYL